LSGIKILGTGHYLPEFVVTNDDFAGMVETSDEWIRARTGIERRHISLGEPTWLMGTRAARQALEAAQVDPKELDMIILTTVTTDFYFPAMACLVQRELGADNAFGMDLSVACAGSTYSLDMARRYLATGDVKTVLVVGTENLSQFINYEDRGTCILFGDGAGACVVRADDAPFGAYLHSDAAGAHHTYCKRSRARLPFPADKDTVEQEAFPIEVEERIYMNGREVYKFATKAMPHAIIEACAKLGKKPEELDLIIPHQANIRILQTAAKNMGITMDKIYANLQECSNTSSASILICLDECVRSGRLKRGDMIGLVGFGAGLTVGASVFPY